MGSSLRTEAKQCEAEAAWIDWCAEIRKIRQMKVRATHQRNVIQYFRSHGRRTGGWFHGRLPSNPKNGNASVKPITPPPRERNETYILGKNGYLLLVLP